RELFARTAVRDDEAARAKLHAAAELFLTTREDEYRACLLAGQGTIQAHVKELGWIACRVARALNDEGFTATLAAALTPLTRELAGQCAETPYGVPYRPYIWGAGWGIQTFAMEYYFLHKAFPELFAPQVIHQALHFILGCHPGSNTASFASGVGANSATTAYGANRADWSYIPGGVISGTALIRPDFPELLSFPYLWQQTEYVLGGGSSRFMFLVLAARELLREDRA
ncbi:MAG: glycoside hydrolase, partial [Clostridia bacterium]|nr:glycoside hydrolase [Clostridia bacterium]